MFRIRVDGGCDDVSYMTERVSRTVQSESLVAG
jgi:hypothetical protein